MLTQNQRTHINAMIRSQKEVAKLPLKHRQFISELTDDLSSTISEENIWKEYIKFITEWEGYKYELEQTEEYELLIDVNQMLDIQKESFLYALKQLGFLWQDTPADLKLVHTEIRNRYQ